MKLKKDYNRIRFLLSLSKGIKMDTPSSRWLIFCIGLAILLLSASPIVIALINKW